MQFTIGDKVLFKKDDLKGEIIRVNSLYKVTVLTTDGFEMSISIKDLVKVESGTDKAISYGEIGYSKDKIAKTLKSQKQENSQSILKVDLHIELLTDNFQYMDNFEIVQIQLDLCQKKIEKALNSNYQKMIIVHGIGTGVLKAEVHKLLSHYGLRYYLSKDSGTTEVML
jgi:dsDNA-specific endonuclease/ATPase MutS2